VSTAVGLLLMQYAALAKVCYRNVDRVTAEEKRP
jgi:hypothetical protein